MTAVALLWRAQLRRRWRSWLALTLLLAIGAGAGLACLAGARRSASAFDRFAAAGEHPDVNSSHGRLPGEAEAAVTDLDGVAGHATVVGFVGAVEGRGAKAIKFFIGPWEEPLGRLRLTLKAGRLPDPDRADEVMVVGNDAQTTGLEPGDSVTVRLFATTDLSRMVPHDVTVVGIGADPLAAVADATYDRTGMYFTPAFVREHAAEQQAWSATELIAAPGTDEGDLVDQLTELGWSVDETRTTSQTRVQDAIRPLVTVLALLGALVVATTLLVVGQALARRSDAADAEREAVRSLGATGNQLRALDAASVLTVAAPGAVLAVIAAIALSALFPTGSVGRLDPASGAFTDWTVLGLGALVVVSALLAIGWSRRRRHSRQTAARPLLSTLTALRPPFALGLRLALGGTTRDRRKFWQSVALTTTGLCLVVGGIAFVAASADLRDEPVRYGATWDLSTRNAFGDVRPQDVAEMTAGDDDIEALTGGTLNSVLVDNEITVPAMAFLPITGDLWPTITAGETPRADDEVLAGEDVLADLDAEIGDEITLGSDNLTGTTSVGDPSDSAAGGETDAPPGFRVTIVGTAVFPSIELAGLDPARLGQGIGMTWSGYLALLEQADLEDLGPDMHFFDLADGVDPAAVIERYPEGMPEFSFEPPTEWLTSLAPAEVIETDRATGLIWVVIVLLAVVVAASLVHALIGAVREHRRDYATLKAIGFTRGQIVGAVASQSMTPIVVSVVIALPVGTALGRWWWQLLAEMLGVVDSAVVPVAALAAVAVVAIGGAGLIAIGPGARAARTPAAALLRDE